MTENEAKRALESLATKYLKDDQELAHLIIIINDRARPGLPVRGVLESIRQHGHTEYTAAEKEVIEELLYLYG